MKNTYFDLIDQTFIFPQEEFRYEEDSLFFHDVKITDLIERFGSPLKAFYLPRISQQIGKARNWFNTAIEELDYQGKYEFAYCTKSNHFSFVLEEALSNNISLETSSEFDIALIRRLYAKNQVTKDTHIVCNGFKTDKYIQEICKLVEDGFHNLICIFDNVYEYDQLEKFLNCKIKVGMRISVDEEPNFEFYSSRLGIAYKDFLNFYIDKIKDNSNMELKMMHFFFNAGIKDATYYWHELYRLLQGYTRLSKICPTLDSINIGGGLPIKNSLGFEYDYPYMCKEIVKQAKQTCDEAKVAHPNIFSEFGKFTVGESGFNIFSVLQEKQQNDKELWYIINNSLMTCLPDAWGIGERFVLLAANKWENEFTRCSIGGLSCDQLDYYNSEVHIGEVYMPKLDSYEPLHLGFFHTGAYQESLSGYGGIKHCLLPSPKIVIIRKNEKGENEYELFNDEQSADRMLKTLGY